MSKEIKQKVKFVFPDNYNPVYANGAWGGYTPRGEFVINFYQDRHPVPRKIEQVLNQEKKVFEEVSRTFGESGPDIVRVITTGVTMNYDAAKAVHAWLGVQLAVFEEKAKIVEIGEIPGDDDE